MTQTIVLENQSHLVSDADLQSYIPAWSVQLNEHLRAFWPGLPVFALQIGTVEAAKSSGAWGAYFQDGIPVAGDLGYHDVETGLPILRIDCKGAHDYGYSVSEVASHEFCEAAVDPFVRNIVRGPWGQVLAEVCDAFVVPGMTYNIGAIELSNFATSAYFGVAAAPRLDMKGLLKPDQLFPYLPAGGYALTIPQGQNAWTTLRGSAADLAPEHAAAADYRAAHSERLSAMLNRGAPKW